MSCTRCGGMLVPDRPVSAVEANELMKLGLAFDRCLSCARRFPVGATYALPLPVAEVRPRRCSQHGLERPCSGCSEYMRAKRRLAAPERAFCACGCGAPVPLGRRRYASDICARRPRNPWPLCDTGWPWGASRAQPLTRTELLQRRELWRAGLYQENA